MRIFRYDGDDRSDDFTGWRATGLFGETFFPNGGNDLLGLFALRQDAVVQDFIL